MNAILNAKFSIIQLCSEEKSFLKKTEGADPPATTTAADVAEKLRGVVGGSTKSGGKRAEYKSIVAREDADDSVGALPVDDLADAMVEEKPFCLKEL